VVLAPLPDALDLGRAAEIITVVGLLMPPALAGSLAGLSARGLGAVALAPDAARVRIKEGPTVLALAFAEWTSHEPASPQAHELQLAAETEENGEKKAGRRTSKKTEEGEKYSMWGRRWHSLHDHFNPTV